MPQAIPTAVKTKSVSHNLIFVFILNLRCS